MYVLSSSALIGGKLRSDPKKRKIHDSHGRRFTKVGPLGLHLCQAVTDVPVVGGARYGGVLAE